MDPGRVPCRGRRFDESPRRLGNAENVCYFVDDAGWQSTSGLGRCRNQSSRSGKWLRVRSAVMGALSRATSFLRRKWVILATWTAEGAKLMYVIGVDPGGF